MLKDKIKYIAIAVGIVFLISIAIYFILIWMNFTTKSAMIISPIIVVSTLLLFSGAFSADPNYP